MIQRQTNFLAGMRIDIPHLRAMESSVAGDFDTLVGKTLAGAKPYVVTGFTLNMTGAIGSPATSLQLQVAGSALVNLNASESGSLFAVPSTTAAETLNVANSNLFGSWTSGSVNYLGLDLVRSADASTTDLVEFYDETTGLEVAKLVPLARTLKYKIVIGTTPFASQPTIVPVALITLDASGNVTAISDARPLLYRLGSGGDSPNTKATYSFANRNESTSTNPFVGGDKALASQRDWQTAIMTRLWELGGGEYWYSATADRNVNMITVGPYFSNNEGFEWTGTNIHWKGVRFLFGNSTGYYNDIVDQTTDSPGLTDLADGECIYADLDRTANKTGGSAIVAAKAALISLGTPTVPGSRYVMAWRSGSNIYSRGANFAVGTPVPVATTSSDGIVRLLQTPGSSTHPVVLNLDINNTLTWTATTGVGLTVTAASGSAAIQGTGTNSPGLLGAGGASNAGVTGYSTGATTSVQVAGVAGFSGTKGVYGEGQGSGHGVVGASTGSGHGVVGSSSSTGRGGSFTGGTGAQGVYGTATSNAVGIEGQGNGAFAGVKGTGGSGGPGIEAVPGTGSSVGVKTNGLIDFSGGSGVTPIAHSANYYNQPIAAGRITTDGTGSVTATTGYGLYGTSSTLAAGGTLTVQLKYPADTNTFTVVWQAWQASSGPAALMAMTATQTTTGSPVSGATWQIKNNDSTPFVGTITFVAYPT